MTALDLLFPAKEEVPATSALPQVEGRILIGGKILTQGFSRKRVESPCTLRLPDGTLEHPLLGTTPQVSAEILQDAVEAASQAWDRGLGKWPTSRMEERVKSVTAFRDAMKKKRESIARFLMWEIAKPWLESLAEFDRTLSYIDDTIEAVKGLDRDCSRLQFSGGIIAQIRRAPLGVTLCMGPFNYPLNETFTTLIPALIMGNTVVVKIPRFGQLLWEELLEPFAEHFPAGVVNIINGEGRTIIGSAMHSGKIDCLAFIGSSSVASKIKMSHPRPHRLRCILGLDAKNPAIILPSADLKETVSECVKGALSFNGQRCTAIKIIYVPKSLEDKFIADFVSAVDALKCAMPWVAGAQITPLPDQNKPKALQDMVDEAIARGAVLANPSRGGRVVGQFFMPAVLTQVSAEARVANEEQFGPIVPIVTYNDISEVEEAIVNSPYGMQASLFGRDPAQMGRLLDFLSNQVCRININTLCQRGPDVYPFTGRKNSAEGTLSVTDALRAFSIRNMVAAKQDEGGKSIVKAILEGDHSQFLNTNILL
jgi:glyceraldehyde-3-phosphate dehydrogenase (NADP+)